jgi:acyl-CoA thioesterase-1
MHSALAKFLLLCCLSLLALAAHGQENILVFGDSLSAGYGMRQEESWPALIGRRLAAEGRRYTVVNASVSGETTAGGLARLPDALARWQPSVVVIVLGANDGLRGLPTAIMRDNLTRMVRTAKRQKARVLLIGMQLPPNYGLPYAQAFERSFADVAAAEKVPLLPFLLAPLGSGRSDFQADGLHPTAAAQAALVAHVWPALRPLLR